MTDGDRANERRAAWVVHRAIDEAVADPAEDVRDAAGRDVVAQDGVQPVARLALLFAHDDVLDRRQQLAHARFVPRHRLRCVAALVPDALKTLVGRRGSVGTVGGAAAVGVRTSSGCSGAAAWLASPPLLADRCARRRGLLAPASVSRLTGPAFVDGGGAACCADAGAAGPDAAVGDVGAGPRRKRKTATKVPMRTASETCPRKKVITSSMLTYSDTAAA